MSDAPDPRIIAAQLRKPNGELGEKVALRMNESNRFLHDFLLGFFGVSPFERILEIGFGNGHFFPDLCNRAPGVKVNGIDYSPEMVAEATAFNADLIQKGTLTITLGESDHLPFPDATFDMVFCINVIYFWEKPEDHLAEIKRVLKPGSKFMLGIRPAESLKKLPFHEFGFRLYDKGQLLALLKDAGFSVPGLHSAVEPPIEMDGKSITLESVVAVAEK
jgi:ubiquinone/menaquinone biosynthesis C-methylase UbiE